MKSFLFFQDNPAKFDHFLSDLLRNAMELQKELHEVETYEGLINDGDNGYYRKRKNTPLYAGRQMLKRKLFPARRET